MNTSHSQNSLSGKLWDRVKSCNSALEDMDDDGKTDYEVIIDDSKNGYLKIGGSYPTCGCSCESTAGAFKTAKGEYVLIDETSWSCGWINEITSNRDLKQLFPKELEETIIPFKEDPSTLDRSIFYLDIEIPQFGTDLKVEIKLIPIGLKIPSKGSALSYYYSQEDHIDTYASYQLEGLVRDSEDSLTIQHLMDGNYDLIISQDMELINGMIKKNDYDDSRFATIDDISEELNKVKRIYEYSTLLKYDQLVLGWDKQKELFYIKSKTAVTRKLTFKEFIEESIFWSPMC
ncbi:MAG: hypothetical protein H6598_02390 [Flavobacteriales bacterium]|nr:hypothetical protein [Flavobacteriales bacterium]